MYTRIYKCIEQENKEGPYMPALHCLLLIVPQTCTKSKPKCKNLVICLQKYTNTVIIGPFEKYKNQ